ncbi:hypothetical protein A6R68_10849 [Neotoma lepida]|uniref:KRAB domain-containing protein n=1 Tax=Neotoma lepida TaxID=56216 RepID=A0A1A6FWS2_NEOLE|nr:hypothetical protein A6R68_10849 [Neotoma lepida]
MDSLQTEGPAMQVLARACRLEGHCILKPEAIVKLEQGAEPWMGEEPQNQNLPALGIVRSSSLPDEEAIVPSCLSSPNF